MPSFDIVSEIDLHELKNAMDNANRELSTRFDFRGVDAEFSLQDNLVKIRAESEFQLDQMRDILRAKAVKRGIDIRSMESQAIDHTGKMYSQQLEFKQGIETNLAKKVVKAVKDKKLKVQPSIQGEQIRVTGKKRDDLQTVIAFLKQEDFGQPFQFTNFRD